MKEIIEQRGNIIVTREKDSSGYVDVITWRDKIKHGPAKVYHPNGLLFMEMNYRNGDIHGIDKTFWEDEKIDIWNFRNGERNGIYIKTRR